MTTFNYTLTLDDSEWILLRQLLPKHVDHLGHYLDEAGTWAQSEACKSLLKKMDEAWKHKSQMSGYVKGKEEA